MVELNVSYASVLSDCLRKVEHEKEEIHLLEFTVLVQLWNFYADSAKVTHYELKYEYFIGL